MKFPSDTLLYLLSGLLLFGCANQLKSDRTPTNSAAAESCLGLSQTLLHDGPKAGLKLAELPPLDLSRVMAQRKFRKIAELNTAEEQRQKSYYILAHLKKNSPQLNDDQILKKYRELFRSCE